MIKLALTARRCRHLSLKQIISICFYIVITGVLVSNLDHTAFINKYFSDLLQFRNQNSVRRSLTDQPQSPISRKNEIRRKCRSTDLTQQNSIGINHVNEITRGSINIARLDDFDTVWNPLVRLVDRTTVLKAPGWGNVVRIDLSLDKLVRDIPCGDLDY